MERTEPLTDSELPRVSIVILNWNGKHHLEPCFETLRGMDYPEDRFEVVLVDNGSDDGSQREARRSTAGSGSWRTTELGVQRGLQPGRGGGAEGPLDPEVLVFLNNDIHVDPGFLRALVAPVVRGECAATTAKMCPGTGRS